MNNKYHIIKQTISNRTHNGYIKNEKMLKIIILIIVSFLNKDKLILKQILEQQELSLYKWKELVNHLFLF